MTGNSSFIYACYINILTTNACHQEVTVLVSTATEIVRLQKVTREMILLYCTDPEPIRLKEST